MCAVLGALVAGVMYLVGGDRVAIISGVLGFLVFVGWEEVKDALSRVRTIREGLKSGHPVRVLDDRLQQVLGWAGPPQDVAAGASGSALLTEETDRIASVRERLVAACQDGHGERMLLVVAEADGPARDGARDALMAAATELAGHAASLGVLVPSEPANTDRLKAVLRLNPFPFRGPLVLWLGHLDDYLRPGASLTMEDLLGVTQLTPPIVVLGAVSRHAYEDTETAEAREVLRSFAPTFMPQPAPSGRK